MLIKTQQQYESLQVYDPTVSKALARNRGKINPQQFYYTLRIYHQIGPIIQQMLNVSQFQNVYKLNQKYLKKINLIRSTTIQGIRKYSQSQITILIQIIKRAIRKEYYPKNLLGFKQNIHTVLHQIGGTQVKIVRRQKFQNTTFKKNPIVYILNEISHYDIYIQGQVIQVFVPQFLLQERFQKLKNSIVPLSFVPEYSKDPEFQIIKKTLTGRWIQIKQNKIKNSKLKNFIKQGYSTEYLMHQMFSPKFQTYIQQYQGYKIMTQDVKDEDDSFKKLTITGRGQEFTKIVQIDQAIQVMNQFLDRTLLKRILKLRQQEEFLKNKFPTKPHTLQYEMKEQSLARQQRRLRKKSMQIQLQNNQQLILNLCLKLVQQPDYIEQIIYYQQSKEQQQSIAYKEADYSLLSVFMNKTSDKWKSLTECQTPLLKTKKIEKVHQQDLLKQDYIQSLKINVLKQKQKSFSTNLQKNQSVMSQPVIDQYPMSAQDIKKQLCEDGVEQNPGQQQQEENKKKLCYPESTKAKKITSSQENPQTASMVKAKLVQEGIEPNPGWEKSEENENQQAQPPPP